MAFRKLINAKNRIRTPSPTGDKVVQPYGWIYKDGEYVYAPKGNPHNHYEETQAARDSVDLKKILARYQAGDEDALNRVNGFYLDTVEIPHTIGELYDAVSNAQNVFESMPIEIREKYDNNPATFWKAYGSDTFDNFLNDYRSAFILGEDPEPVKTAPQIVMDESMTEKKEGE